MCILIDPILEIDIRLISDGKETLVDCLSRQIRLAIQNDRLKPGFKMPSTRSLANSLGVSRNTIIASYDNLAIEGYIETLVGDGTYVTNASENLTETSRPFPQKLSAHIKEYWRVENQTREPAPYPDLKYSFKVGSPDVSLFPFEKWRKHVSAGSRQLNQLAKAHWTPQGILALRDAVAQHISLMRAVASNANEILICNGAQQALNLIATILVSAGKTKVAMEFPYYFMARDVFSAAGADIVPINVDSEGIVVSDIPLDTNIIYVTPSHQFPLGIAMSAKRRLALLDLAMRKDMLIIEDDYDSDFRLSGPPIDALKTQDNNGVVFYVGTFSKNLLPELRIGYLLAPSWSLPSLTAAKFQSDWHTPTQTQMTLASFITSGELRKHIRKMQKIYSARYFALKKALSIHCSDFLTLLPIRTGLHATATLIDVIDAKDLASTAANHGIAIRALTDFCAGEALPNAIVFGFGCINADDISAAIAVLGKILLSKYKLREI